MAGTQSEERGDSGDLDVFDEGGKDDGPTVKPEELPHDIREADAGASQRSGDPDLSLGESPGQTEDPADIFTDTKDGLDLEDDEVESADPIPTLNLEDEEGDEKGEDDGKGGSEGLDQEDEPPLESVDLPDLTFTPPPAEPPLASNEAPEVTYGSTDEAPELESVELPELTFNVPQEQMQDGASEVVFEEEGDDAVVYQDDDEAVVLEDSSPQDDETEVEPLPDYPDDEDDEDGE